MTQLSSIPVHIYAPEYVGGLIHDYYADEPQLCLRRIQGLALVTRHGSQPVATLTDDWDERGIPEQAHVVMWCPDKREFRWEGILVGASTFTRYTPKEFKRIPPPPSHTLHALEAVKTRLGHARVRHVAIVPGQYLSHALSALSDALPDMTVVRMHQAVPPDCDIAVVEAERGVFNGHGTTDNIELFESGETRRVSNHIVACTVEGVLHRMYEGLQEAVKEKQTKQLYVWIPGSTLEACQSLCRRLNNIPGARPVQTGCPGRTLADDTEIVVSPLDPAESAYEFGTVYKWDRSAVAILGRFVQYSGPHLTGSLIPCAAHIASELATWGNAYARKHAEEDAAEEDAAEEADAAEEEDAEEAAPNPRFAFRVRCLDEGIDRTMLTMSPTLPAKGEAFEWRGQTYEVVGIKHEFEEFSHSLVLVVVCVSDVDD